VTALGKERHAAGVRQVEKVQAEFAETISGTDRNGSSACCRRSDRLLFFTE